MAKTAGSEFEELNFFGTQTTMVSSMGNPTKPKRESTGSGRMSICQLCDNGITMGREHHSWEGMTKRKMKTQRMRRREGGKVEWEGKKLSNSTSRLRLSSHGFFSLAAPSAGNSILR